MLWPATDRLCARYTGEAHTWQLSLFSVPARLPTLLEGGGAEGRPGTTSGGLGGASTASTAGMLAAASASGMRSVVLSILGPCGEAESAKLLILSSMDAILGPRAGLGRNTTLSVSAGFGGGCALLLFTVELAFVEYLDTLVAVGAGLKAVSSVDVFKR